jgi:tripartite-type tricarboxylate transporter receptor subunit TctC
MPRPRIDGKYAIILTGSAKPSSAGAQDYPSRPITLIVPYAAGGGNDVMARTAAEKMSKTLGQQIIIENRGGAGGSIATRQIAKERLVRSRGFRPFQRGRRSPPKLHKLPDAYWASEPFRIVCSA